MKRSTGNQTCVATCFGSAQPVGLGLLLLAVFLVVSCRKVDRSDAPPDPTTSVSNMPEVTTTSSGFEMVLIPAGSFQMGSQDGESDEAPVHAVQITAFWIDRYEMTQQQWSRLAGQSEWLARDPSHFKGAERPVEMIGWDRAALFCNVRSRDEGLEPCYDEDTGECHFDANGYRLPTEAEWEYACRAGSSDDYSFGSDTRLLPQYAWYADNASKQTHPVGQKKPNAWGIFDMHGNVAEWCNDRYDAHYYQVNPVQNPRGPDDSEQYILRGGAWNCSAKACRTSRRVGEDPGFSDACFARDAIGFRCVRRVESADAKPTQATEDSAEDRAEDQGQSENNAVNKSEQTMEANDGSVKQGKSSSTTGLVYDDAYLEHDTGTGHPERPERLTAIVQKLETTRLRSGLITLKPKPASIDWIATVHTAEYIERVKSMCESGERYVDSPDAPVSEKSYEVARLAAGGVLTAVDAVMAGKVRNAFCAVRPPGHHALKDRAMGFCLFNNVAIAARYVQEKHGLSKVLIVDWDVHHGNGTQAAFDDDPSVLYFSVHQYPFYPGTGSSEERGTGAGVGFTVNAPLPAGSDDVAYTEVFDKILKPAARPFQPDFVFISAGFDAHEHDLLGQMKVTASGFATLTRVVKQIADESCGGRLVSVLEGGYDLDGLAESAEQHIRVLLE